MNLEQEMQHEVARLEKELRAIDEELDKLNAKTRALLDARKKIDHDLRALRGVTDEEYIRRADEESLAKILERKVKA